MVQLHAVRRRRQPTRGRRSSLCASRRRDRTRHHALDHRGTAWCSQRRSHRIDHPARTKLYRTWGDCFGYFALATAGADLMLDPTLAHWDVAAIVPVVEAAGGMVTSWNGGDPLDGAVVDRQRGRPARRGATAAARRTKASRRSGIRAAAGTTSAPADRPTATQVRPANADSASFRAASAHHCLRYGPSARSRRAQRVDPSSRA